jgi:hypothetical protein
MTERVGPALARMRLSTHLRELRDERPAADVARAMHWSVSKLNRIENNKVTIQPVEVEALIHHYGVTDPAEVERLVGLSVASRRRLWWRDEHEHLDEDFLSYIAFENDAAEIFGYHATWIPWPAQTPEYATALVASIERKPPTHPDVRKVVDVRRKRQETLADRRRGPFPPRVSLVIDEGALLRPVGGDRVMAAQLDHLVQVAAQPGFRVVALPFRLGVHPGFGGAFELLTFAEDDDLDVVFIETPASDFLLTDTDETATYRAIRDELLATDPSGEQFDRVVANAIKALRS